MDGGSDHRGAGDVAQDSWNSTEERNEQSPQGTRLPRDEQGELGFAYAGYGLHDMRIVHR